MKGENLWTLVAGAILGGGIIALAIIANNNEIYLFILAGLIFGMAVAGVVLNKVGEFRRKMAHARRQAEKEKNINRLRREFRKVTSPGQILPTYTDPDDPNGFGNGVYGDPRDI
jgi:hypothetical protein